MKHFWGLDPGVLFLNHGSFGACPLPVLEAQQRWRERMEREPVRFFVHDLEEALDASRSALARFLGAGPRNLAFVPNATAGVNAVLRSLDFRTGDELLTTNHAYNACRTTLDYVASRCGARVVVATVPFPVRSPAEVVQSIVSGVTPRTRLALIDHVTSPTALIFPIAEIISRLRVPVLVDGAHAPAMVPLAIESLGADWYTGNCHKWLCAPKGAGFLWVHPRHQASTHPTSISHGYNSARTGRSRFLLEFDWTGTDDPTPALCIPDAIRFLSQFPDWMQRNHALAIEGRRIVCDALSLSPPAPDDMLGSMASLPLPDRALDEPAGRYGEALQDRLVARGIQVPIVPWPQPGKRLVRISAQLYNSPGDYAALASALRAELGPGTD
ncbi:MAG: aminotransferase class V-fold PLP-dependent enzyme [Planctomycetota bacterium]|nr:MAG: aminotransferase class V-fold PLP-dependent enzyme [Planctomycetota bacterium]